MLLHVIENRYPLLTADEALLCTLRNWLKAESEAERSEKERVKVVFIIMFFLSILLLLTRSSPSPHISPHLHSCMSRSLLFHSYNLLPHLFPNRRCGRFLRDKSFPMCRTAEVIPHTAWTKLSMDYRYLTISCRILSVWKRCLCVWGSLVSKSMHCIPMCCQISSVYLFFCLMLYFYTFQKKKKTWFILPYSYFIHAQSIVKGEIY